MINNPVVKEGRKCPNCGEVADKDFASCMGCGHDYTDRDPLLGFDENGMIVQVNGKAVTPTKELPNASSAATATAAPAIPAPVVPANPDTTTSATTGDGSAIVTAPAAPAASAPAPVAVAKRAYVDIVVDESPRQGYERPAPGTADYYDPPKADPKVCDLTDEIHSFGGLGVETKLFFLLKDDQGVSRQHGKLHRLPDGGYQLENNSKGCPVYIRQLKKYVEVGERITLTDGMELEVGDWFTFTYHEQAS